MKKKIIESVAIFFAVFFVGYLLSAFITWELNPARWDESERGSLALWGGIVCLFLIFWRE